MANKPSPRLLPTVKYDPPPQKRTIRDDAQNLWDAAINNINATITGYNQTQQALGKALSPVGDYLFGQGGKVAYPEDYQQKVGRPMPAPGSGRPVNAPPNPYATQLNGMGQIPGNPPQDVGWTQGIYNWLNNTGESLGLGGQGAGVQPSPSTPPPGTGKVSYAPGDTRSEAITDRRSDIASMQDAVNKNQALTEQAKAAGDAKEMARLQAEWDRIAPKAAKYGITAERLVNSYMQPGNSAAESSLDRALGRAIADDTWANAASIAFGRPPNQMEWDEHWQAMNRGGRDPLEGHPAAIQAIQAKMKEIEQENQNEAFSQYQSWLANQ